MRVEMVLHSVWETDKKGKTTFMNEYKEISCGYIHDLSYTMISVRTPHD